MAPSNEEVVARVSAAVAGGFQPEHVNSLPMRPEEGCLDLVSPWSHRYSASIVWLRHSSSRIFRAYDGLLLGDDRLLVLEASGDGG
jgi:hypothetical protein